MSLEGVKMTKKNRYNREFRTPEEIKKEHEAEKAVEETVEPVADDKTDELKTEVEEEPVPKPAPEELISADEPEVKRGTVIAELLNVRTAPEVGDNVIGKLKKNTPVEIITKVGTDNTWFFVKGEMAIGISVSGYVMSKYIDEDK